MEHLTMTERHAAFVKKWLYESRAYDAAIQYALKEWPDEVIVPVIVEHYGKIRCVKGIRTRDNCSLRQAKDHMEKLIKEESVSTTDRVRELISSGVSFSAIVGILLTEERVLTVAEGMRAVNFAGRN